MFLSASSCETEKKNKLHKEDGKVRHVFSDMECKSGLAKGRGGRAQIKVCKTVIGSLKRREA